MKKQILFLGALALVVSLSIFACGGGASTEQTPATEQPADAAPAAPAEAAPAAPADSTAAQPGGGAEK